MPFSDLRVVRFFKNLSLGREILFWMTLAGLVPLLILAIPEFFFAEEALIDAERRALQQALHSRVSMIDEWLNNVKKDLKFISNSNCVQGTCSRSCSTTGEETACPFQNSVLKSHLAYRSIQAYDKDLSLISRSGDEKNCSSDLSPEQLRAFFSSQENFHTSSDYCFDDDHTIMTVGWLVRHQDGKQNSYVIAHLDLNEAIDSIDPGSFLDSGKFYILSRQGMYLYPPRSYSFLHRKRSNLSSSLLASGSEMFMEYEDFRQEPVFASFAPVSETDWLLVKEVDKNVAVRWRFLLSTRTGIAILATVAIVLSISFFISRKLTRPLRKLAAVANTITLGSKTKWEPAPSFPYREIDEVGMAFNEMQERLKESEKKVIRTASMAAIGNFSSGIVHEIRSPLSAINLALQSMAKKQSSEPDQERLDICIHQAGRLMRMLDQILAYGKPLELNQERTLFSELLSDLHSLTKDQFEEKNVSLQINAEMVEDKPFDADRELIIQAITNILNNALQWSPEYSCVELAIYPDPDEPEMMTIRIADMGAGFEPDTMDGIFKPFYSKRPQGIGLGLAITQKIIELHGGAIRASNRTEGGAEIFITLPFSADYNDD